MVLVAGHCHVTIDNVHTCPSNQKNKEQGETVAKLNNDRERKSHRVTGRDAEQILRNQQMRCGGDGDEFSQSLYDTEEKSMEEGHKFLS